MNIHDCILVRFGLQTILLTFLAVSVILVKSEK